MMIAPARGVRILARTAPEAVRDPLGNRIGEDVARVAARALRSEAVLSVSIRSAVVALDDPFHLRSSVPSSAKMIRESWHDGTPQLE
jgi:hypothetical protein